MHAWIVNTCTCNTTDMPQIYAESDRDSNGELAINPQARDGFVYIIAEAGTSFFKVGRSIDPITRRRNLQTGNPRLFSIREQFEVTDDVAAEGAAHRAIAAYRANLGGGREWFNVNPDDYNTFYNLIKNAVASYLKTPTTHHPTWMILACMYTRNDCTYRFASH